MTRWTLPVALSPLVALVAVILPLHAAQPPAVAGSRHYAVAQPSRAIARVRFFGLTTRKAMFPQVDGSIILDPRNVGGIAIDVTLDATQLIAGDRVTRDRLKGPAFFDVARTRDIRFSGDRMRRVDATHALVDGQLTARGVSRPVTLAIVFSQPVGELAPGSPLRLTGSATIDRTAFGMTAYPLIVGRNVTIDLDVTLRPRP